MPDYHRYFVPGGTYFFTVVVHRRRKLFDDANARRFLREAIATVKSRYPFDLFAICLLPDHLHCVWTLPRGETDYPMRWRRIKEEFTQRWLGHGGSEVARSASRQSKNERGIWQRRYWEHTVRDEAELKRCVDYVHWNPRKHGLVTRIRDWPWSSFFRFVEKGEYVIDWGGSDPCPDWHAPEWGE